MLLVTLGPQEKRVLLVTQALQALLAMRVPLAQPVTQVLLVLLATQERLEQQVMLALLVLLAMRVLLELRVMREQRAQQAM